MIVFNEMVSVDFFPVPTIRFQVRYVFLVLAHDRRRILQFGVTAHPTAEWTVQQCSSHGFQERFAMCGTEARCAVASIWRPSAR
jgi:hypothetical protein